MESSFAESKSLD